MKVNTTSKYLPPLGFVVSIVICRMSQFEWDTARGMVCLLPPPGNLTLHESPLGRLMEGREGGQSEMESRLTSK